MMIDEELSVVIPADWVPGPRQGSWTYDDYAALPDDGQLYEIVNGVLLIRPVPIPEHQSTLTHVTSYLLMHVQLAGLGRVFPGPVDVELGPKNVFEPDVVVVLNANLDKVATKRIIGAPDLVVEIASPSTAVVDRVTKYEIYAHSGISEYWIVKPTSRTIEVLILENGEYYSAGIFRGDQLLPSRIVPELPVRVEQFFL